jgi:hypothetical protein
MEAIKIVMFATAAAIVYGVLHDLVTAHVCVEYFTIAHPPIFPTSSPILLALGWGVVATWWVGLPLGGGLAIVARLGTARKVSLAELRRPIAKLMIFTGLAAFLAGSLGASLVAAGAAPVPGGWAPLIPADKHIAFSADAWAHLASYGVGTLAGLFLIGRTLWCRVRGA